MRRIRSTVSWSLMLIASLVASEATSQQGRSRDARGPEAGLQLVGTAVGLEGGLAIIRQSDGRMHVLKPGRDLRGYTVTAIEPTRVVLKKDERELTLETPRVGRAETPVGQLAAARQQFAETVGLIWRDLGGGEAWHEGNAIMIAGPSGLLEASVAIPDGLWGGGINLPGDV